MAEDKISLELPREEAEAVYKLCRRLSYEEIKRLLRRDEYFVGSRPPEAVCWSALRMLERQLMEAGICQAE